MVNSYDDMMGSPMDPSEHEVANVPQATEHYAGEVSNLPSIPNPAPLAPISPFEQYNVSAGQGRTVKPHFGMKDMRNHK